MRVLIFGATGLLGKALLHNWNNAELHGLGSRDADIRDRNVVGAVVDRVRPDWIVLAAAFTDVDGCESNPELAFAVNCEGAVHVAQTAKKRHARLLFLSTDYVFDGTKTTPYETSDARAPRSVYGCSKAKAEEQIVALLPECCIVRTSWLFGAGGRCFPGTILKLAASRKEIDVVNDQRGSPTYAPDLAQAIAKLCEKDASGIVHVTNAGDCTWFELAQAIVRQAGLSTLIRPSTSDKFVRPAERPRYSVLSSASLSQYGIAMPKWEEALRRYLVEMAGRS